MFGSTGVILVQIDWPTSLGMLYKDLTLDFTAFFSFLFYLEQAFFITGSAAIELFSLRV